MPSEDKNYAKIQRLLNLMSDDALTKEDFLSNFKIVIDFVKKIDKRNLDELRMMNETLEKLANRIDIKAEDSLQGKKQEVMGYCEAEMKKMYGEHEEMLKKVNEKMAQVQNGLDGKDADEEKMKEEVLEECQEPILKEIENRLPQFGTKFRDGLEILPEGEKLNIDAIENLRKELNELKEKAGRRMDRPIGGGSTGKHTCVSWDIPTAQLNGVTKIFTLPAFWNIITVFSSSHPNAFMKNVDYTFDASASTITFTSTIDAATTLAADQTITILYNE